MMPEEKQYRRTVNRIAFAMLLFYGAFNIYSLLMTFVVPLFTDRMPAVAGSVTYELIYGLLYAAVFLLPVLFFYILSRHEPHEPLDTAFYLPRLTPLYIIAGVALISAAGYLNSMLLDVFDYGSFTDQMIFDHNITLNYQLILLFFTLAIVPAFVEELLFRGMILQSLLPYGRTTAVLFSALLFGVMHQNAGQLLYATVAGLFLGYVYATTRSFWCCVLIHFCNNFLSLVHTLLLERLPEENATLLLFLMEIVLFVLGIVAAVYLILHQKRDPAAIFRDGAFEKELPPDPEYAAVEFPISRRVRLFFSAPMIVFFVLCAAQMLTLLGLSLLF